MNRTPDQAMTEVALTLDKIRSTLAASLEQTHNAVRLRGARCIGVGNKDGRAMAWGAAGRLVGWSIRAVDKPATVALRDSRRAGQGEVVAFIDLPSASSTQTIWLGPGGVSFTDGLYLEVLTADATVQGSVYVGAVD